MVPGWPRETESIKDSTKVWQLVSVEQLSSRIIKVLLCSAYPIVQIL